MRKYLLILWLLPLLAPAQAPPPAPPLLLRPAAVFDGEALHPGWAVLVQADTIAAAGPAASVTAPAGA